jgi:hypothetical protein
MRKIRSIKTYTLLVLLLSFAIIIYLSSYVHADEGQTVEEEVSFGGNNGLFNPEFDPSILKLDENYICDVSVYEKAPEFVEVTGIIHKLIIGIYKNDTHAYHKILEDVENGATFIEFCRTHYPQVEESVTGTKKVDEVTGEEYIDPNFVGVAQKEASISESDNECIVVVPFHSNDDQEVMTDVAFYFEYLKNHWRLTKIVIEGSEQTTGIYTADALDSGNKPENSNLPAAKGNMPYSPFVLSMGTWLALQIYRYRKSISDLFKKFLRENKEDLKSEISIALGDYMASKLSKNVLIERGEQIVLETKPHFFKRVFKGLGKLNKLVDTADKAANYGVLLYTAYKNRDIKYAIRGGLKLTASIVGAYYGGMVVGSFCAALGTAIAGPIGGVIGGAIGNVAGAWLGSRVGEIIYDLGEKYAVPKVVKAADKVANYVAPKFKAIASKIVKGVQNVKTYLTPKVKATVTRVSQIVNKAQSYMAPKIKTFTSNIIKLGRQIRYSVSNAKTSFIRNLIGR